MYVHRHERTPAKFWNRLFFGRIPVRDSLYLRIYMWINVIQLCGILYYTWVVCYATLSLPIITIYVHPFAPKLAGIFFPFPSLSFPFLALPQASQSQPIFSAVNYCNCSIRYEISAAVVATDASFFDFSPTRPSYNTISIHPNPFLLLPYPALPNAQFPMPNWPKPYFQFFFITALRVSTKITLGIPARRNNSRTCDWRKRRRL